MVSFIDITLLDEEINETAVAPTWATKFQLALYTPLYDLHIIISAEECSDHRWRMQWQVPLKGNTYHIYSILTHTHFAQPEMINAMFLIVRSPVFMAIKAIFPDLKKKKKSWIRVIVDWATLSAVVGGLLITINSPDHLIRSAVCGIWKTTFLKMPCRPCTQWNFRSGHKAITTSTTMREFDGITIFLC